jgi:hypothetical protein
VAVFLLSIVPTTSTRSLLAMLSANFPFVVTYGEPVCNMLMLNDIFSRIRLRPRVLVLLRPAFGLTPGPATGRGWWIKRVAKRNENTSGPFWLFGRRF